MLSKEIKMPLRWLILGVVSIVFLLYYSVSTSPLTVNYGADSAFFTLVGKGMTEGMLPYRDFFDMKGPYLFLIEYIGQLICRGRNGAFILQVINLVLCVCLIDKIYHREQGKITGKDWLKDCLFYMVPCFYVYTYTLERGNLTEEFSLPLLLLVLYFALDYLKKVHSDPQAEHPLKYGLFYGFAFGVLALIRITNAAFIGAVLAAFSLDLLLRKKFGNLILNGLAFILGCVLAFVPMCLYYWHHGLLQEMLSQVFEFGVLYSGEHSMGFKVTEYVRINYRMLVTMAFPMAAVLLLGVKDWRYWVLTAASYLLLFLACIMGNGYAHYLILGIPHLVLGFSIVKDTAEKKVIPRKTVVLFLLLFLVMARHVGSATLRCGIEIFRPDESTELRQQVLQIRDEVPVSERDSVYVYNLPSCSNWYLQADIYPCHRYCDWQEHYISLNPEIGIELTDWMVTDGPEWIVTANKRPIRYRGIADAIENGYEIHMQNDMYTLYHREK